MKARVLIAADVDVDPKQPTAKMAARVQASLTKQIKSGKYMVKKVTLGKVKPLIQEQNDDA